jgi:uncharacterized glyoxalase superfamily protein PhnB
MQVAVFGPHHPRILSMPAFSLQRIIVNTHNPSGLADFYANVLGFDQLSHDPDEDWYLYDAGGMEIGIHAMPEQMDRKWQNKLCFVVDDIEVQFERLGELGLPISNSISTYDSWQMFDVTDPFGNDYQFIQKDSLASAST